MELGPTDNDRLPDSVSERDSRLQAGKLIAELREEAGLDQVAFASRVGLSRSVIANAETGRDISKNLVVQLRNAYPGQAERVDEIEALVRRAREAKGKNAADPEEDGREDMFLRRASSSRRLTGLWHALWETTADQEEVVNSEEVVVTVSARGLVVLENSAVSPENPEGGYLWRAEGRLFDNQYYLGTYIPREAEVRSKGCLYLVLHPSGKYLNGQWMGCNYDGDWARGLVVFARESDRLPDLLNKHRRQLPPVPYTAAT